MGSKLSVLLKRRKLSNNTVHCGAGCVCVSFLKCRSLSLLKRRQAAEKERSSSPAYEDCPFLSERRTVPLHHASVPWHVGAETHGGISEERK